MMSRDCVWLCFLRIVSALRTMEGSKETSVIEVDRLDLMLLRPPTLASGEAAEVRPFLELLAESRHQVVALVLDFCS